MLNLKKESSSDIPPSTLLSAAAAVTKSFRTAPQTNSAVDKDFYHHSAHKINVNIDFIARSTALQNENKKKETDKNTPAVSSGNSNNSAASTIQQQTCIEAQQEIATAKALSSTPNKHVHNGGSLDTELLPHQSMEATTAREDSPCSSMSPLLLLPGVTDRRKIIGFGESTMVPLFRSFNSDEVSTEVGSESRRGRPSSSNSLYSGQPLSSSAKKSTKRRHMEDASTEFPSFGASGYETQNSLSCNVSVDNGASRQPASCELDDAVTKKATCHNNSNSSLVVTGSFDDKDVTPESRFSRLLRETSEGFNPWRVGESFPHPINANDEQFNMMSGPNHQQPQPTTASNPTPLLIHGMPHVIQISAPPDSLDTSAAYSRPSAAPIMIPGLASIQKIASQEKATSLLPWRVKYISSANLGAPNSHECLTDATTADGNPDYEDDDEELGSDVDGVDSCSESNLELPAGVSQKVRFLPLQPSAIYEYEQFDWYDESDELGIFVDLDCTSPTDGYSDSPDDYDDGALHADPAQLFIPLIGNNRQKSVEENEVSDGSPSSCDYHDPDGEFYRQLSSPRTRRHEQPKSYFVRGLNSSSTNECDCLMAQQESTPRQRQQPSESSDTKVFSQEGMSSGDSLLSSLSSQSSLSSCRCDSSTRRSLNRERRVVKGARGRRDSTPHPNRRSSSSSLGGSASSRLSSSAGELPSLSAMVMLVEPEHGRGVAPCSSSSVVEASLPVSSRSHFFGTLGPSGSTPEMSVPQPRNDIDVSDNLSKRSVVTNGDSCVNARRETTTEVAEMVEGSNRGAVLMAEPNNTENGEFSNVACSQNASRSSVRESNQKETMEATTTEIACSSETMDSHLREHSNNEQQKSSLLFEFLTPLPIGRHRQASYVRKNAMIATPSGAHQVVSSSSTNQHPLKETHQDHRDVDRDDHNTRQQNSDDDGGVSVEVLLHDKRSNCQADTNNRLPTATTEMNVNSTFSTETTNSQSEEVLEPEVTQNGDGVIVSLLLANSKDGDKNDGGTDHLAVVQGSTVPKDFVVSHPSYVQDDSILRSLGPELSSRSASEPSLDETFEENPRIMKKLKLATTATTTNSC